MQFDRRKIVPLMFIRPRFQDVGKSTLSQRGLAFPEESSTSPEKSCCAPPQQIYAPLAQFCTVIPTALSIVFSTLLVHSPCTDDFNSLTYTINVVDCRMIQDQTLD